MNAVRNNEKSPTKRWSFPAEATGLAPSGTHFLRLYDRQEIVDPIFTARMASQAKGPKAHTRIPDTQWEEVAQRHSHGESLRHLAKTYGVSYEAVRQVIKKAYSH